MTAATLGRHSIGRHGLVPFVDRRRSVRSHRRPSILGQLARTIRERFARTEGQPETAGATVPTERKGDMSSMMPEGRWLPAATIPDPEATPPTPPHPEWCVCGHDGCPGTDPAPPIDGPTVQLDPFTIRPYVLRSNS